jgi:LCP family protein required for cell wall assembly
MNRKRTIRILRNTLILLLLLFVGALGYTGYFMYSMLDKIVENPLKETPEELGISESAPKEEDTGVVNILLFGLDTRVEGKNSRSDTIMIATIDKKNQAVKLTSLMRDMYVSIPGKQDNRINAAYAFGGPTLAIKTVNTNFNLDIQRYATVDFFALEKIVDKLGGITINVKAAEIQALNNNLKEINRIDKKSPNSKLISKSGPQLLNGKQAVAYARIRKVGHGDYERTERQRAVMSGLFKKAKSAGVLKLADLVSTTLPHVETNMSKGEIMSLGMSVMGFRSKDIQQYRLPVDGTFKSQRVRGMAVLVPDMQKNTDLLHKFIYE